MQPNTFLKQLLFSTVRIVADTEDPKKKSLGTGFLVVKKVSDTTDQIFLITNKHVIAKTDEVGSVKDKFKKASFSFLKSENGNPKLGESVFVYTDNLTDMFLQHPDKDVDLAISNISDLYNKLIKSNQNIFIQTIPIEMIPSESESFDAIEDILFVGYPNGIFDQKNHLPIMRRGITASPYNIDFNGNKKFIVDAQVFPGSSGSPVFIKEQNLRNGTLTLGTEKYFFVGIISKVFHREETGDLTEVVAPTTPTSNSFSIKQMIGLGICEKSSQVIELIDLLNGQTSS
jgi:V8-like Glu-specific endopeptidase